MVSVTNMGKSDDNKESGQDASSDAEFHEVKIFGAWAYNIEGEVDYAKPFPNYEENMVTLVDMISGTFTDINQIPKDRLEAWKKMGATHIMLCRGEKTAIVMTIRDANIKVWLNNQKDQEREVSLDELLKYFHNWQEANPDMAEAWPYMRQINTFLSTHSIEGRPFTWEPETPNKLKELIMKEE